MPPGISAADLAAKPFHIYHEDFYAIIGSNPSLTILAETATDPLYHEAFVWLVHFFGPSDCPGTATER